MMVLSDCPYCHQADRIFAKLQKEHPEWMDIPIRKVDESVEKEFADSLDYYYVPTCYVNGEKLHEGVPTEEKLRRVLEAAAKG